jgi:hypothetical protein
MTFNFWRRHLWHAVGTFLGVLAETIETSFSISSSHQNNRWITHGAVIVQFFLLQ